VGLKFEKGNKIISLFIYTNDEIGVLSNQFEHMRFNINKKISVLERINRIGEVLAQLKTHNQVYVEVIQLIAQYAGFNYAYVALVDAETNLDFIVSYIDHTSEPPNSALADQSVLESSVRSSMRELDLLEPMDGGLIELCCKLKRNSGHIEKAKGQYGDYFSCCSQMIVPLLNDPLLKGVLLFVDGRPNTTFEEADYTFIKSITRLLMITISNLDLVDAVYEQNRTLEHKVALRTAQLQEKTDDMSCMLQNMDQGLFTILPDLSVHSEYSIFLESVFEKRDIAGQNVLDLLFEDCDLSADKVKQIESAIVSMIGDDEIMYQANGHLLVSEYVKYFFDGRLKTLELDWNIIVKDGEIGKMMVTVRDVTIVRELQAEAEKQKIELSVIREILAIDPAVFDTLCERSLKMIRGCVHQLEVDVVQTPSPEDRNDNSSVDAHMGMVDDILRQLHTIKGNARMHNFHLISEAVHLAENTVDRYRNQKNDINNSAAITDIKAVDQVIFHYHRCSGIF
jgi:HPt (histidine-containing phosphotransfer) domain-containing protein